MALDDVFPFLLAGEFALDQRILTRTPDVTELFPPGTLDLA